MITWHGLSLIYLGSGIALLGINRIHRIIPPQTRNGWIALAISLLLIVAFWWVVAAPYAGLELSNPEQSKHLLIAVLIQYPMVYFLFRPLLKE